MGSSEAFRLAQSEGSKVGIGECMRSRAGIDSFGGSIKKSSPCTSMRWRRVSRTRDMHNTLRILTENLVFLR